MTENTTDPLIPVCPFCGGTERIEAYQTAFGDISATSKKIGG